jgi:hypothetical protein
MRSSVEETGSQEPERRKEARHKLVLRAAVVEQDGRAAFCLVRNISSTGVQLKVYTQPILGAEISLRVADEPPVSGRVAWVNGDNAGISLDEELNASTLLRVRSKLRPHKRRAFPRMEVEAPVILRTRGRVLRASVRDISSLGARVVADTQLQCGDRTIIEFPDLPAISGYVRWAEGQVAGLAFETPIPLQIIAHWLQARLKAAA